MNGMNAKTGNCYSRQTRSRPKSSHRRLGRGVETRTTPYTEFYAQSVFTFLQEGGNLYNFRRQYLSDDSIEMSFLFDVGEVRRWGSVEDLGSVSREDIRPPPASNQSWCFWQVLIDVRTVDSQQHCGAGVSNLVASAADVLSTVGGTHCGQTQTTTEVHHRRR